MTKKDCKAIARIIHDETTVMFTEEGEALDIICRDSFIGRLSEILEKDNSRFDRYQFIDACISQ